MKILMVSTGLGLGGAERMVIDLANRMHDRGHEVMVAHLVDVVDIYPVSAVALKPLRCSKTPWGILGAMIRLAWVIWRWRPDVVHSHMLHANLFTRAVRLVAPMRKLICTAHSTNEGGFWAVRAYRLSDWLATLSTNVSSQSVSAFEQVGAVPAGRMIPISNGIDISRFEASWGARRHMRSKLITTPNRRILLSVARLVPEKNHSGLLIAFASLLATLPDVDLWIVGDGVLRNALSLQCNRLGLGSRVNFLGARRDVPELLQVADVFVLPSHIEGMPLVLLEAMAAGIPVVATECGGTSEVVCGHGFLVPVDDGASLRCALMSAFNLSHEARQKLTNGAKLHVKQFFDIERCADKWEEVYRGD